MVTEKMIEAISKMAAMCENEDQKKGMEAVQNMLSDFTEEAYEEQDDFVKRYLP